MTAPLRWGVLGAASIAVRRVIPAMQRSAACRVDAIASRDLAKARAAADALGIPRAYGSYEELLADPEIDAVYNPLPNHLHVPWSERAAAAGKHVLCEKPIALTADEARALVAARDRAGVQIAEAFMVRTHPQWHVARDVVRSGRIGELKLVTGHFSYHRRDPSDVRNRVEWGGGVLLDVGCYPITMSRWLFGAEPAEVVGTLERDPEFGVDRLAAGLLRFPTGMATFGVGGQIVHHQRVQILGTAGRIELEIPFSPPGDHPTRLLVDDGRDVLGTGVESIAVGAYDQFTLQADRFAAAVRGEGPVPVPLEDAIANMAVIDAIFRSVESGRWESPAAS
ncbi:oxidoreductase domain protein [Gemmatirosa kalamazoonensis]|uniref:Oxidoreductase domain protein n=1 Tax=Gemmatirosa kalamazoonensis TaxID=861299 RepID=W0RFU1_9BACT|nr:Gfo/Idh/MocA family oxidoreductase [Gemmatirosa kalamazoonensis]AHG89671.1 oxidoreductase domain protein [Gemmatirosa kalamazoonensis]